MRKMAFLGLVFLLAGCGSPPAEPQVDEAAVRQAIEAANASLGQAVDSNDAAAFANVYTEDGILMVPNIPATMGRQAIQDGMSPSIADMSSLKLTTAELEVHGDTAVERGTYTISVTPPGSSTINDSGKYVVLWKNTADGWKMKWDIWNSDQPLPSPPADDQEPQ